MNFIKRFLNSFFLSLGLATFSLLIINIFNTTIMWSVMCSLLIISFASTVIFKKGVSYYSLWIRRVVMLILSIIVVIGVSLAYNTSLLERLNIFIPLVAGTIIILTTILYIIADIIERKYFKKMNTKLKEYQNL